MTEARRGVIRKNGFLRRIYEEWYRAIADSIPAGPGRVLELGSGAGFLRTYLPGLIPSEVFMCSDVEVVLDARRLPFRPASLKAIVMVDVLHHVPDARGFLQDAARCLRPGASIAMVEPWLSTWSRPIYAHLHHEPFDPAARDWAFPDTGPLSGANTALPWIIFERDRLTFERDFPEFRIRALRPMMAFRYLVSGGVSMRQLMPEFTYPAWERLDRRLCRWPHHWSMFAFIELVRL
jgi:SAM-dependent methyltransferase